MERIIKFRAFSQNSGNMTDWEVLKGLHASTVFAKAPGYHVMQFTGLIDRSKKEVFEGDIIRVFDIEPYCVQCEEWEDCDGEDDEFHKEHGEHAHEDPRQCENYVCTQEVRFSYGGWFCAEDTGEFCPSLYADEIEMEIIGNKFENPELLTNNIKE